MSTANPPSMLIAHYKMNDNLATAVVLDAQGNYNGTYKNAGGDLNTNTGTATGKTNLALDFDGIDEYIEIPDADVFTPAGTAFSISVWVYMHDATSFMIASKGVYNTDAEWYFVVSGSDKLLVRFFDESVDDCYIGRQNNTAITAYENQWIHLVCTYDGGTLSSGIKIYLNSTQVDDTDNILNQASFVAVENLAHAVWIGRYDITYANGLIDNVMFFNKELNQYDIDYLYNNGLGTEGWGDGYRLRYPGSYQNYYRGRY